MNKSINIFFLFFIILFAIYSPLTKGYFAFVDDYIFVMQDDPVDFKIWFSKGIPLYYLFNLIECSFVHNMQDANIARFFSIAILSMVCTAIYLWFKKKSIKDLEAVSVIILIVTTPTFCLNLSWMVMLPTLVALLTAVVAALVAFKAIHNQDSELRQFCLGRRYYINKYHLTSCVLLFISLCIYQPSALFYWALIAVPAIKASLQSWREERKTIISYLIIGAVAFSTYMLFLILVISQISPISGRGRISSDMFEKIIWFITNPTVKALNFFSFHTSTIIIFFVIIIILSGFLIELIQTINGSKYNKEQLIFYFQKTIIVFGLIFMCAFTYFLKENNSSYHIMIAYPSILIILFYFGVIRIKKLLSTHNKKVVYFFGGLIVIASSVLANDTASRYIMTPHSLEIRYLKYRLQEDLNPEIDRIHIIRPLYFSGFEISNKEEIGVYSSTVPNIPSLMVKFVLSDLGMKKNTFKITEGTSKDEFSDNKYDALGVDTPKNDEKTLIIDMRKLESFR